MTDTFTELKTKVPQAGLLFWVLKMMSTTVGETGADWVNFGLGLGLTGTSLVSAMLYLVVLLFQLRAPRYIPWLYWLTVLMVSITGTLLTDYLTDQLQVPLLYSVVMFGSGLVMVLMFWHRTEGTLEFSSINTLGRELYYWLAIMLTFAFGTALGDALAEKMSLGYLTTTLLFAVFIASSAVLWRIGKLSSVASFWTVYVLTRPLGASLADLFSQPIKEGGLGYGTTPVNIIFLLAMAILIGASTLYSHSSRQLSKR
ncbi:hypothetical protein [Pantoea rwandensis]|uniref:Membrane-anchored protein n=1 Tax=Pantoea rwandensis TaxID=1076550 RepID=A0A1X1D4Y0_9GAMM|nr:hypothetical protein [Pantoea rwandensis]ORM71571.1 hypothetical protein HA51_00360 [Pantoea rwandensis]